MSTDYALVWFDAISATLSLWGPAQPRLSYQIRHDREQGTVELTTDEDFNDLQGVVDVVRDVRLDSTDHIEVSLSPSAPQEGIGYIKYYEAYRHPVLEAEPHPASYAIEVHVPVLQFDELLAAAQIGRLPSLLVGVEGMKCTIPFDPPVIGWDNKALPQLKIDYVRFHVPLTPATGHDDSGPTLPAELAKLSQRIDRLDIGMTRRLIWLFWAVLGLLGICALILFRR